MSKSKHHRHRHVFLIVCVGMCLCTVYLSGWMNLMAAASVAVRLVCYLLLLSADVNAVVAAAVCILFLLAPFFSYG